MTTGAAIFFGICLLIELACKEFQIQSDAKSRERPRQAQSVRLQPCRGGAEAERNRSRRAHPSRRTSGLVQPLPFGELARQAFAWAATHRELLLRITMKTANGWGMTSCCATGRNGDPVKVKTGSASMIDRRLRYRDLLAKGIVNNRTTLGNWIRGPGISAGQTTGPNTRTARRRDRGLAKRAARPPQSQRSRQSVRAAVRARQPPPSRSKLIDLKGTRSPAETRAAG